MIRRTLLFIPGNSPSMLMNSVVFGSDSIIFDLEDAVAENQKDAARILVRNTLRTFDFSDYEVCVRINNIKSEWWKKDITEIMKENIDTIVIPKAESAEDIMTLSCFLTEIEKEYKKEKQVSIIPILESPCGIENSFLIASSDKRVDALFLGAEDLTASINAKRSREGEEIYYSRSRVVIAAKACGIAAIDTPFTDTNDLEALKNDTVFAKNLGFDGKAVISPRHIDIVNTTFLPTQAEIEYAEEVLEAIKKGENEGKGAVSLNGEMIDAPIVNRAKQILKLAGGEKR